MSTTEQIQASRDKGIIQKIGYKEFKAICEEYQIVEQATKEMLKIATDPDTPIRVKVDIYKWVVEMNIGKATQRNDITLQDGEDTKITIINSTLGNKEVLSAVSQKYSIPLKELEDYQYQIGCKVERQEYKKMNGAVDLQRIMQDVENGIGIISGN